MDVPVLLLIVESHRLDQETQWRTVGMLQAGISHIDVAEVIQMNRSVTNRL